MWSGHGCTVTTSFYLTPLIVEWNVQETVSCIASQTRTDGDILRCRHQRRRHVPQQLYLVWWQDDRLVSVGRRNWRRHHLHGWSRTLCSFCCCTCPFICNNCPDYIWCLLRWEEVNNQSFVHLVSKCSCCLFRLWCVSLNTGMGRLEWVVKQPSGIGPVCLLSA